MNANLKLYAEIKNRIKVLEEECESLKPMVMDAIYDSGSSHLETEFGTFSITERKSYEYPTYIIEADTEVKRMKKEYESSRNAVVKSVIAFPTFKVSEPKGVSI